MRFVRIMLLSGYVALCALAFVEPRTPRVFWTMLMPAIPLAVIVIGFAGWRRLCPLAFIAALGARFSGKPKLPRFVRRRPFTLSFAMLYFALAIRLIATNGDGVKLGTFLVLLATLAIVVNAIGTGKSWCNYLCPVGVVERIYTDPGPIGLVDGSSSCTQCSGCKKTCPDIDPERAYRSGLERDRDRQFAFYAFPGLVLSFYAYYWLHEGEWAAFFDGRWTSRGPSLTASGLFFAPSVPIGLAAPFVLAAGAAASWLLFCWLERLWSRRRREIPHAIVRHQVLALSSFAALNLFYFFAGAPALMRLPGASALVAFVVPLFATLVLLRSAIRSLREANRRQKETVTDKSLKIQDPDRWPASCKAPSDVGGRRRVALVVLH